MRLKLNHWLLVVVLVVLAAGCATMQRRWQKAESVNTISVYEEFLEKHPSGNLAVEARDRIEKLKFEKAQAENTIAAYKRFLNFYGKGERAKQARFAIKNLRFDKAKNENTIEAYEEYLRYDNSYGDIAKKVHLLLEKLKFEKSRAENTVKAYLSFISSRPYDNYFVKEAREEIMNLRYKEAVVQDNIYAYQSFIKKYPKGRFTEQAESRLEELKMKAFLSVKTVRIIVDQENLSLPFADVAGKLLRYAGIKGVNANVNTTDASLKIQANGHAKSSRYTGSIPGRHYSGAYVSGHFSFKIQDNIIYKKTFEGIKEPPTIISQSYRSPSSAPFRRAFERSNFALEIIRIIRDAFGPHPLYAALKDKDSDIQWKAAWALGEIKDPRAIMPLVKAMKDYYNHDKSKKAMELLGDINDIRAVDPLICALMRTAQAQYTDVRGLCDVAAVALGKIRKPAVQPLIATLKHENSFVRQKAAEILGEIMDPRAVKPLILALKNKYTTGSGSLPAIVNALEKIDPDWRQTDAAKSTVPGIIAKHVRGDTAVETLEKIDHDWSNTDAAKGAVPDLIAALRPNKDEDWVVQKNAAKALGEIKDPRAIAPLIATLKHKYSFVREPAEQALDKIDPDWRHTDAAKSTIPDLIAELEYEQWDARTRAAEVLGVMKDPRAVEPLVEKLKDENATVRRTIAKALGMMKDPRAIEPLVESLEDKNSTVRIAAAEALKHITGEDLGKDHNKWQEWWQQNKPK